MQSANRWQHPLKVAVRVFVGAEDGHKSFSESVSANSVRFYCSLIIQMNALSC